MHIEWSTVDFRIPARSGRIRVIECQPGQIVTGQATRTPRIEDGLVTADPNRDLLKLAVIERHRASGRTGLGFVCGLGLKTGALASTVAHDSHNLIVAGCDDEAMLAAARLAASQGGGLALVTPKESLLLPLPVAGLMAQAPVAEVSRRLADLTAAARRAGSRADNPFMLLSFLALPVIPELKLTDRGLIDVTTFSPVDLWAG